MNSSSFLLRTLLGLTFLPLALSAQERFLDLEFEPGAETMWTDTGSSTASDRTASKNLPTLELANRAKIMAHYEEATQFLDELAEDTLSRSVPPTQDAETGAELQRSDLTSTSLGTAGGFFSATLGVKGMQEKSEWDTLDTQGSASVEFAWRIPKKAFAGVLGLAGSYARQSRSNSAIGGEIDTWVAELYFGGKGYLEIPDTAIWGYAGVGVSLLYTEVEGGILSSPNATNRSSDFGVGVYAQLGLLLRLNRSQSIGIEYRGLFGTNTTFFNTDISVDYNQFNFVFLVAF